MSEPAHSRDRKVVKVRKMARRTLKEAAQESNALSDISLPSEGDKRAKKEIGEG